MALHVSYVLVCIYQTLSQITLSINHLVLLHSLVKHICVLMVCLGQYSSRHLKLASIEAHALVLLELIGKFVAAHVLLDSINNLNDVIDVFLEFFPFLETCHANEIGCLVIYL